MKKKFTVLLVVLTIALSTITLVHAEGVNEDDLPRVFSHSITTLK